MGQGHSKANDGMILNHSSASRQGDHGIYSYPPFPKGKGSFAKNMIAFDRRGAIAFAAGRWRHDH
jgi:hypothetical protein